MTREQRRLQLCFATAVHVIIHVGATDTAFVSLPQVLVFIRCRRCFRWWVRSRWGLCCFVDAGLFVVYPGSSGVVVVLWSQALSQFVPHRLGMRCFVAAGAFVVWFGHTGVFVALIPQVLSLFPWLQQALSWHGRSEQ